MITRHLYLVVDYCYTGQNDMGMASIIFSGNDFFSLVIIVAVIVVFQSFKFRFSYVVYYCKIRLLNNENYEKLTECFIRTIHDKLWIELQTL